MKKITVSMCNGDSLSCLTKKLDEKGIKKEDYNKVYIELDWSNVYYESESPEIKAVFKFND